MTIDKNTLYITGAGVSAESGIPTFRGKDGFWTIGSKNYAPQEMATRQMYQHNPFEFLSWYYHRFAIYQNHQPNDIHYWLADKNLITQNIDGLDKKAGNTDFIAVHGQLDKMTIFHEQGDPVTTLPTPWNEVDKKDLKASLLQMFNIEKNPILYQSYKPYVLLFDEYYTELYRISDAQQRMKAAKRIIFMGTSFSVNITQMALNIASFNNIPIEIVDPNPAIIHYPYVTYHPMTAMAYIKNNSI